MSQGWRGQRAWSVNEVRRACVQACGTRLGRVLLVAGRVGRASGRDSGARGVCGRGRWNASGRGLARARGTQAEG